MKIIKEFFLDFWRELIFGILILSCLFLLLGYRSRGDEIITLKSELSNLNSTQDNIVNDSAASKPEAKTQTNLPPIEVIEEETSPYEGFNLPETSDWTFTEGNASSGYTFSNGSKVVDVVINPTTTVVASDVAWTFGITDASTGQSRSVSVSDSNENFCVAGQANCTFGDGRLQVLANQTLTESKPAELQFFLTDDEYVEGGDTFSVFKNFIESIEVK